MPIADADDERCCHSLPAVLANPAENPWQS
jgi:hypothetical protein